MYRSKQLLDILSIAQYAACTRKEFLCWRKEFLCADRMDFHVCSLMHTTTEEQLLFASCNTCNFLLHSNFPIMFIKAKRWFLFLGTRKDWKKAYDDCARCCDVSERDDGIGQHRHWMTCTQKRIENVQRLDIGIDGRMPEAVLNSKICIFFRSCHDHKVQIFYWSGKTA